MLAEVGDGAAAVMPDRHDDRAAAGGADRGRDRRAAADFFSFGTNDLTQTTWGFSRDDVEARSSRVPEQRHLRRVAVRVDRREGVGAAGADGRDQGRATTPDLKLGVCGEHGGDPRHRASSTRSGLDYVSCSPFRVPVARLEAGRSPVGVGD